MSLQILLRICLYRTAKDMLIIQACSICYGNPETGGCQTKEKGHRMNQSLYVIPHVPGLKRISSQSEDRITAGQPSLSINTQLPSSFWITPSIKSVGAFNLPHKNYLPQASLGLGVKVARNAVVVVYRRLKPQALAESRRVLRPREASRHR